jgi:hypothetical protein
LLGVFCEYFETWHWYMKNKGHYVQYLKYFYFYVI